MPCALLPFSHTCLPAATAGWDSYSLWATGLLLLLPLILLSTADLCVSHLYLPLIFISHRLHLSPREALLLPSCCDYVSRSISAFRRPLVCACVCACFANGEFVRPHACAHTVYVIYHVAANAVCRACLRVSDDVPSACQFFTNNYTAETMNKTLVLLPSRPSMHASKPLSLKGASAHTNFGRRLCVRACTDGSVRTT